ncbi:MAG: hypothetical protein M5U16_11740 [Hyphomicrobium sp.]|nr:hypothetical protein [Hyphomicrobium sp.]
MRWLPITLVCSLFGVGSACADGGGSITLEEVIDQLQDNQALVNEVLAELKVQKLKAEELNCVGFRFGGYWLNLGGARAVPYECEIGNKKLNIDGTVHVYDDDGTELDRTDKKSFERATEYRQADITWRWQ